MADDPRPSCDPAVSFANALDALIEKYRDMGILSVIEAVGALELVKGQLIFEDFMDNKDDDDSFVIEEEGE